MVLPALHVGSCSSLDFIEKYKCELFLPTSLMLRIPTTFPSSGHLGKDDFWHMESVGERPGSGIACDTSTFDLDVSQTAQSQIASQAPTSILNRIPQDHIQVSTPVPPNMALSGSRYSQR